MRFVLVGPVYPYRGGIAHYTTMLQRALRERSHKVLLVSFKRQYPQRLFPGQSDKDPSKEPLTTEEAHYWIDSLNPLTWLTTFWRIRRHRPDTVILQWWTTFWAPAWFVLGLLIRLFLQRPLIYICHNVLPHEVRWWDSWLAKATLRWGTRFVVQSVDEQKKLTTLIEQARVSVVPHPIYDMFASKRIQKKDARRQLGLPPDVPILLFFGIVREYKGLEDLLTALPEIRAQLGDIALLVAGEFWEGKASCLEMIEQLEIGDSVVIEDRYIPNEELALYFSAAEALVVPYRQVTGSGVVQMALGFRCPVITTTVGGLTDLIHDGENVLLVPPSNSEALAAAIVRYFTRGLDTPRTRPTKTARGESSWATLLDAIESVHET